MRISLATKQQIDGFQRKLAWFDFKKRDLYFEIIGDCTGSHTSWHKTGEIIRTNRWSKQTKKLCTRSPLSQFKGLSQLGIGVFDKGALQGCPPLRIKNTQDKVWELDLDQFPSSTINIVAELLQPGEKDILSDISMRPPPNAILIEITAIRPWLLITVLGQNENLLVAIEEKGFTVKHYNERFSANRAGEKYYFEARA